MRHADDDVTSGDVTSGEGSAAGRAGAGGWAGDRRSPEAETPRETPLSSLFLPLTPASALLAVAGLALILTTLAYPFARTADDSLFYLEVARNVAAGNGFSFDGVTSTNGVQPLWQLVVVAVVAPLEAVGLDGDAAQLRAVIGVGWVLLITALWVLDRLLLRLRFTRPARLVACAVLLGFLGGPMPLLSSEAHVVALALVVTLTLLERSLRSPGTGVRPWAVLGLSLGVLMLGRLDTVFTAGAILLVLGVVRVRSGLPWVRPVLTAFAAASAVVVPYLAVNLVAFDRVMPISGALKVDLTDPRFRFAAVGIGWVLLVGAAVAAAAGYLGARPRPGGAALVLALLLGSATAATYYWVGAQRIQTHWPWYFVPSATCVAIAGAAGAERILRSPHPASQALRRGVVALGTAAAALGMLAVAATMRSSAAQVYFAETSAFARDLAEIVPAGERIAVVDRPGILAYTGTRGIVAMDGLTQDFEFQADLNELGAACTLQERGIGHLVTYTLTEELEEADPDEPYLSHAVSWLSNEDVGTFVLMPDQRRLTGGNPSLTLWELRPQEC